MENELVEEYSNYIHGLTYYFEAYKSIRKIQSNFRNKI